MKKEVVKFKLIEKIKNEHLRLRKKKRMISLLNSDLRVNENTQTLSRKSALE